MNCPAIDFVLIRVQEPLNGVAKNRKMTWGKHSALCFSCGYIIDENHRLN